MIIQWFPGHMNKALKTMEAEIKNCDAVIYVLDSRAPFSCVNPKFTRIIGDKPIVYAFNKVDLADIDKVNKWVKYFTKENTRTIMLNSTSTGSTKSITNLIKDLNKAKIDKYKAKNINITLKAIVIGVPNCGKSTLINNLCGSAKTITGNKAGVTRGKQWVRIANGIDLLDMPGTLWPAFDNNTVACHLAYIGSIKDEVLDIPELSLEFIREMVKLDKAILEDRYTIQIDEQDEPVDVLEKICIARKYLLKKGEIDYDRGAIALINEFKSGRLGNITLESVEDIKLLTKKDRKNAELRDR